MLHPIDQTKDLAAQPARDALGYVMRSRPSMTPAGSGKLNSPRPPVLVVQGQAVTTGRPCAAGTTITQGCFLPPPQPEAAYGIQKTAPKRIRVSAAFRVSAPVSRGCRASFANSLSRITGANSYRRRCCSSTADPSRTQPLTSRRLGLNFLSLQTTQRRRFPARPGLLPGGVAKRPASCVGSLPQPDAEYTDGGIVAHAPPIVAATLPP